MVGKTEYVAMCISHIFVISFPIPYVSRKFKGII